LRLILKEVHMIYCYNRDYYDELSSHIWDLLVNYNGRMSLISINNNDYKHTNIGFSYDGGMLDFEICYAGAVWSVSFVHALHCVVCPAGCSWVGLLWELAM
jgi:hypothetical protein